MKALTIQKFDNQLDKQINEEPFQWKNYSRDLIP